MNLFEKIVKFVQHVDQNIIFKVFKWTGFILSSPVFIINALFKKPPLTFIPIEEDFEDLHTFRHFAMASILTTFAYGVLKRNPTVSFLFGFLLMYAYEILDGFRLIDKRGFQMSDIGADFFGAFFIYIWLLFR